MKLIATLSLAGMIALSGTAYAQTPAFVTGWNYIKATNCLLIPGTPAAIGTPATQDEMEIFVDIVQSAPAPGNPPPPATFGQFSVSDPVTIATVVPFCKDGSSFYIYWDGTKALYFSLYPH